MQNISQEQCQINNNENNPINDKYGHCHCIFVIVRTLLDRSVRNIMNDCSSPFSFQDRCVSYPN